MKQSIATRTGDDGTTGLLYNRRVPKTHPQIAVVGAVDELSAYLTVARTFLLETPDSAGKIQAIQDDLVGLMAEIALDPQDWDRYASTSQAKMDPGRLQRIDQWVEELEATEIVFQDWNLQQWERGEATLEYARTLCRRAERAYWGLDPIWHERRSRIGQYLNRLADLLWLMARKKRGKTA